MLSASVLSHMGKEVALFEALDYLGGCAGTFQKEGYYYNVGAATFVGVQEGMPVGILAKLLRVELPTVEIDPSMVVHIKGERIRMWQDLERSVEELERAFGGFSNRAFWSRAQKVSQSLWKTYCSFLPYSFPLSPLRTLLRHPKEFLNTFLCNFVSAERVAKLYLGGLSQEYKLFLDHLTLITAQGFAHEVPFSAGAMGMTYTNLKNYYAVGGMGELLRAFASKIKYLHTRERVKKVEVKPWGFVVRTNKGTYETKRVIMNTTVWNVGDIVEELKDYSQRARRAYAQRWGAFVIYMTVRDMGLQELSHHHFILLNDPIPYTQSRSLFVSLSDPQDPKLSKEGTRSITISTHTLLEPWENLSKEEYEERKEKALEYCLELVYRELPSLRYAEKIKVFAGTPKTFARYTMRYRGSVGGIPLTKDYFPFGYPSPFTPVKGLYVVGDTVFPGQGWPGVAMGVINLLLSIEKELKLC